jgi:opacity protein-like surface antigen
MSQRPRGLKRAAGAGLAAVLLALLGATAPAASAQAQPYDCERSGTIQDLRTITWVAYLDGLYYGYETSGLLVVSSMAPWVRPSVVSGHSNADGSLTTVESVRGNRDCP